MNIFTPLLHHHNVWNHDNGPDLVPGKTNNSTFAAAAEFPRDPLEGAPIGPHFPPPPEGSLVDRSREVADYEGQTKRLRLPTKTYIMDDDNSL
jgi:hypothetical protein